MNKTYKITIVVFLFLVGFLTYVEAVKPKPLNWSPSYTAVDKIPLGSYILYDYLQNHYKEIEKISQTPFEFLSSENPQGVYFFVNSHLQFDKDELDKLLNWVAQGNSLFLASDAFSKNLLDTLNLNTGTILPTEDFSSKPMLNLVQPDFTKDEAYLFDKEVYHSAFIEIDTLQHTVLGISELYSGNLVIEEPQVNYISVPHGKGQIFLNTSPQAFSNFFLLHEDNFEYVERALAYLPAEVPFYWDANKKAGITYQTSPLYILLSNEALKWAYYFTLFGALLFVLFEGKRKQRPIPVIEPLQNQTYHFTRTVAGMYIESRDYKKIAVKKIALFLEYVRLHLRIPTDTINEEFYNSLASLSGKELNEVKQVFRLIQDAETRATITQTELLALSAAIDTIKQK